MIFKRNDKKKKQEISENDRKVIPYVFVLIFVASGLSLFGTKLVKTASNSTVNYEFAQEASNKSAKEIFDRAKDLQAQDCAACHSTKQRLIGPSYAEIASHYKTMAAGSEHATADTLAFIAGAIKHSTKNWSNFPDGPKTKLPWQDRLALAQWIVISTSAESQSATTEDSSPAQGGEQK